MTILGWSQIAIVLLLVLAGAWPMSQLIHSVYLGERNFLSPVLRPVETVFYRLAGVDEKREQSWRVYALAMIALSIAGFVSLFALLLTLLLAFGPLGAALLYSRLDRRQSIVVA